MTDEQAAWVAGIIEGEGYLRDQKGYSCVVNVTMCDRDVLDRLKEVTGMGNVTGPYGLNNAREKSWQPAWQWNVGKRRDARILLETIYPWMCERRRQRIDELRPLFSRKSRQGWKAEKVAH